MSLGRRRQSLRGLVIGSGLAAVVGYLAGILTAPKSGRQTRGKIKVAADKRRLLTEKELKGLHTELDGVIKDAKQKYGKLTTKTSLEAKKVINKAADTKEKVREVISAVHQGDASDQDLKRAVKNAQNAIEHLRDYLKK